MTTILAAIGAAIVVLLTGNVVWAGFGRLSGLGAWNLRVGTAIPWAILPTIAYLWAYWNVIGGRWSTPGSERRHGLVRAGRLSAALWRASLAAGLIGLGALVVLLAMVARLVTLPAGSPITTPVGMPMITAMLLLTMQSVVAGVSEEAAFRGYMQNMIERRFGVTVAILISGTVFGLLHFGNHPRDVVLMLPYYIAVSAVYGGLTWATGSILPAVVLHAAGDTVVLNRWWLTGRPEWQIGAATPRMVWESGLDASFVAVAFVFLLLAGTTVWSYGTVRRLRLATIITTSATV